MTQVDPDDETPPSDFVTPSDERFFDVLDALYDPREEARVRLERLFDRPSGLVDYTTAEEDPA